MAFACHRGLYEYNVIPFGLANALGIFQELMSVVLHGLDDFAMTYMDDIIILAHQNKRISEALTL